MGKQAFKPEQTNRPMVRVYRNIDVNLAHNTAVVVTFTTVLWDTHSMFNAGAADRVTIPFTGKWTLKMNARFGDSGLSTVSTRQLWARKNAGATIVLLTRVPSIPTDANDFTTGDDIEFTAGDWIQMLAYQNCGITIPLSNNGIMAPALSLVFIG